MRSDGIDLSSHDVAQRAGVGIATLYRRFPTRETLVEAVIADCMDDLDEAAAAAASREAPGEAFFEYFRCLWRAQVEHPGLMQALSIHGFPRIAAWRGKISRTIQKLLRAAQANGDVRTDLSWRDVPFLISATAGLRRDAVSLHAGPRQADRLLEVIVAGLRPGPEVGLPGRPPRATEQLPDLTKLTRSELSRRARALGVGPITGVPRDELERRLTIAALARDRPPASSPPSEPGHGWS